MSFLWIALGLILGIDIRIHVQVAGREWFGAVFQETCNNSTRLNFSKTTQRQFSGEPIGAKPLSLSPPY